MSESFARRNGFARLADLAQPELQEWRERCLGESERFDGKRHLDWSRQWEYPYALANLPAKAEGQRVLDAGSGWRFLAPMLARAGFHVFACDLDGRVGPRYEEVAEREQLALEFSRENLEALRYADASFDAILCISVLEHTANPERIALEFWRCLAPGGRLVLTFDVSVDGSRDIPVAGASDLLEVLAQRFQPRSPFEDRELLDEQRLAGAEDLLRTASFRHSQPELLPWRMFSRATLDGLKRGRIGRPFFDLAVVGVVYEKPAD